MRRATVRDLRYRFHEIETRLKRGEEIALYKRQKLIGRLVPIGMKSEAYPDFAALRRRIFAAKKVRKTGTDLMSEERGFN
jgi:antitoxin (DNA-binding transcriptional repressor) of toxin-antitoxin stability system